MPKIEWNESFSVNNKEIDQQHQKWLEIFNKLHESLLKGKASDYKSLNINTLKEMLDYAKFHFDFEEKYMRQIDFPDLIPHRRLHRDFDTQIYQYYREAKNGHIVLNTTIIKIIKNWLLQHIMVEDQKYNIFSQES